MHPEKEALKRYELWIEQKGQCIYTGRMISLAQLFSIDIDIEHTIPRSLLPDNTLANQTVAYARYNREIKNNQIPALLNNYEKDWGGHTAILPRLDSWIDKRDYYKEQYQKRQKASGVEDEKKKNQRIQDKHYYKMHYDYWHDKTERFLAEEIKESWARRQLVDTQMVSKYAREFLKTYFKKVTVQKGSVTADFRKIYGFQEEDEIKNRNRHTHHAIDAAVLSLIPSNSSHRDKLLKKMYETFENERKQFTTAPFEGFNAQKMIRDIENTTLIVNYEKDNILKKTFRNIRKRGKLQYVKNIEGEFVRNEQGKKITLKSQGDTARSTLFKQSFIGKIREVDRDIDGKPLRGMNKEFLFKNGKEEFIYVERKPIKDVLSKIEGIVDPSIKELIRRQKNNPEIKDHQGNIIRHVRIKTKAGQPVKERINFRSKYDYKNHYYSAAGSVPYAILLQKSNNGKPEREMLPIASYEVVKISKKLKRFDIDKYISQYPDLESFDDRRLLKVGQRLIVLRNDAEYDKRFDNDFIKNRLFVITKFSEGSIWLKYHLEAQAGGDIDDAVKNEKDRILRQYEIQYGIPEVVEDNSIQSKKDRQEDYVKRRYSFAQIQNFRFSRLSEKMGLDSVKQLKKELDKFKTQSASIEVEGKTPLLKISKENWNFLYEGHDFEISILGEIKMIPLDVINK
jgi:CRISPR-associated endonuclease Csn1